MFTLSWRFHLFCFEFLGTIEGITLNPNVEASAESPWIFDGMVLFNKMRKIDHETFGKVSEYLLKKIMKSSSTVYLVTDQYVVGSIKSLERAFRATQSGTIRVRIDRRDQFRPKQWSKYLRDADSKEELVALLLRDWQSSWFFLLLARKTLYVNYLSCFFKLTCDSEEVYSSLKI